MFLAAQLFFLNIKRDWSNSITHILPAKLRHQWLNEDINHTVQKDFFHTYWVGVRYGITEKLSFSLEGTYRILNTDYLDGFSQAANPDKNDHYHTLMAGLIYSLESETGLIVP
jgi:predicted porin